MQPLQINPKYRDVPPAAVHTPDVTASVHVAHAWQCVCNSDCCSANAQVSCSKVPVSSSSNSLKAFIISSRESRSPILAVIICKNSSKSIVPLQQEHFGSNRQARAGGWRPGCSDMPYTLRMQSLVNPPAILVDISNHLFDLLFLWLKAKCPAANTRSSCYAQPWLAAKVSEMLSR